MSNKTIAVAAFLAMWAGIPGVARAENRGTWADCGLTADFEGSPATKTRTGGAKGIVLDYLQFIRQPDLLQQAYCFPAKVGSADDMWQLQAALASDARIKELTGNVAAAASGWMYLGSGTVPDANGRPMRIEFQCRSLARHVACLSVGGPKDSFPRRLADRFFASVRPAHPVAATTEAGNPGDMAASMKSAGIGLDASHAQNPAMDSGKGKPWGPCVAPLLRHLKYYGIGPDVTGFSSLKERKSELGRKFTLLVKRSESAKNGLYECELSPEGDFIGVESAR